MMRRRLIGRVSSLSGVSPRGPRRVLSAAVYCAARGNDMQTLACLAVQGMMENTLEIPPVQAGVEGGVVVSDMVKMDKNSGSSAGSEGIFFKKEKAGEAASELEDDTPVPVVKL